VVEKIAFDIVSPERLLLSDEADMVTVPGSEGDFGVLAGLQPTMATLKPDAELSIYKTDGAAPEKLRVRGGFAEVNDKGLTVLAEAVGD